MFSSKNLFYFRVAADYYMSGPYFYLLSTIYHLVWILIRYLVVFYVT